MASWADTDEDSEMDEKKKVRKRVAIYTSIIFNYVIIIIRLSIFKYCIVYCVMKRKSNPIVKRKRIIHI